VRWLAFVFFVALALDHLKPHLGVQTTPRCVCVFVSPTQMVPKLRRYTPALRDEGSFRTFLVLRKARRTSWLLELELAPLRSSWKRTTTRRKLHQSTMETAAGRIPPLLTTRDSANRYLSLKDVFRKRIPARMRGTGLTRSRWLHQPRPNLLIRDISHSLKETILTKPL
jgi:hypothetical protein